MNKEFIQITVYDTGTEIKNVLVAKISDYPRWIIYDPSNYCSLVLEHHITSKIQSLSDVRKILQTSNQFFDVKSWSSRGATMLAFFVFLQNWNSDKPLPFGVDVSEIRLSLIQNKPIPKAIIFEEEKKIV